jgi:hypothetical protein
LTFHLQTITIDCRDWRPLVDFWSAASDFAEIPGDPNNPGDPVGGLMEPSSGLRLLFIPVPEPKTIKNRVHFDVQPLDGRGTRRSSGCSRSARPSSTTVASPTAPAGSSWATRRGTSSASSAASRSAAARPLGG